MATQEGMARTVFENECDRSVSSVIKSGGAGLLSGTGKSQIMAGSLEGKVAVISGGATGIGLATTKKFGAEGAHVFHFLVDARLSFASWITSTSTSTKR